MSSSFYSRRLQGIFTNTRKLISTTTTTTSRIHKISPFSTTTTTTTTVPTTKTETSIGIPLVVQNFKKNSESARFRLQRSIYERTVRRLAAENQFSAIESILDHQKNYKDITNEGFAVRLISLYGRAKMFDHARKLFDELPSLGCQRTVMSFNALLYACVNSEKYDIISEMFIEIPKSLSIEPDTVSYNTLMKGLCEMDQLDSAIRLMDGMEKNGLKPNIVSYNTILDAYYKSNRLPEAEKLWALMEDKNVVADLRSYNVKLRGLVVNDRVLEAVELLKEMEEKGVKPDANSYQAVMKGFAKDNNLEEAKKLYERMLENGYVPDRVTFRVIIDIACDKDDFDYALEVCRKGMDLKQYLDRTATVKVVDGLVERSRVEEANELVEAINSSTILSYELKVTATE